MKEVTHEREKDRCGDNICPNQRHDMDMDKTGDIECEDVVCITRIKCKVKK